MKIRENKEWADWKKQHPTSKDIVFSLGEKYRSENRWRKSMQHLKERGELENAHRDIGKLLKEISKDVHEEYADEIKAKLFRHAWPHISKHILRGFPEWYKEQLAQLQFEKKEVANED